jgi:hypothetical protein
VNVTETVQVDPAARVVPQAVLDVVMVKSAVLVPVRVMPEMFNTALPVLESIVDRAVDVVPAVVLGKANAIGERLAIGAGAAVPVPDRATVCGVPVALSATEIDAV